MRLLACLVLVGCGGRATTAPRPTLPRAAASPAPVAEPAPTRAACDRVIAHALALGVADQRAQLPPDRAATAPQEAQIAAQLRDRFGDGCLALTRATVRCALAAATTDALVACDAPPAPPAQPIRSSSTSNSSVAPGGITPPAPRSP